MQRAIDVIAATTLDPRTVSGTVALDYDRRHRRRLTLETARGQPFLLDLPEARHLRHGDGLVLEDGTVVLVEALPEPLLEIRAADAAALMRIAWHLGNRHVPTQLCDDRLCVRADHVIGDLVHRLNGSTAAIQAPFDPEGGAYGESAGHSHAHQHHVGHDHGHAHDHV
jgi:urease accessory protein